MAGFIVGKDFIMQVKSEKEAAEIIEEISEERYSIERYGNRFFALYDHQDLVCVTVYKKGAEEVQRRLEINEESKAAIKNIAGDILLVTSTWTRADVISTFKERFENSPDRPAALTDEEISTVLYSIEEHFDAECGISWTTIVCAIEDVLENR